MADPDRPTLRLRRGAVSWQQVDGETILLDLATSEYLGANAPGSVLWPELVEGATRDGLVARLRAAYDVPAERAVADVDAFLADCRARGYLEDL